jgi:hypothetical protein
MNKETLTARERVIRAINHQPVDRVPIDMEVDPRLHLQPGPQHHGRHPTREYRRHDGHGIPGELPLTSSPA